jgi:hypothetical protein
MSPFIVAGKQHAALDRLGGPIVLEAPTVATGSCRLAQGCQRKDKQRFGSTSKHANHRLDPSGGV